MKNKWVKKLKPFLIIAIVLFGLYLSVSYILDKLFEDMCVNEIVQKLRSPNEDKVAYIFREIVVLQQEHHISYHFLMSMRGY
ncbi:hypothetical protein SAMN05443252_105141 [Bacillus sp. OV322]|nr:hypothetical protein SAMN05443252_105141 [Bacillus sp. OV322]